MTEAEWLACDDPQPMLDFLYGRTSARKERLFACAAVRRVWQLLADDRLQEIVEEAERYADGIGYEEDRALLYKRAKEARRDHDRCRPHSLDDTAEARRDHFAWKAIAEAADAAALTAAIPKDDHRPELFRQATLGAMEAAGYAAWSDENTLARGSAEALECAAQTSFLRDLFGTFFAPHHLSPAWLISEICPLAQGAYNVRLLPSGHLDPTRLAILADALEEAGCSEQTILAHLRSPGPHVRGCWVVDLILTKEQMPEQTASRDVGGDLGT
jgi:hypothetical protein